MAAFAYVLSWVAAADLHISTAETDKMVEIVERVGHIPEERAVLVVEVAKALDAPLMCHLSKSFAVP